MSSSHAWLKDLKVQELHRLAIRIGTPCSGTKPVLIRGIRDALSPLSAAEEDIGRKERVHLVSIDMGIRNLAYSKWTTNFNSAATQVPSRYERPVLNAWRKIDISSQSSAGASTGYAEMRSALTMNAGDEGALGTAAEKETFEPLEYADHAYRFVKNLLDEHRPTHVIIERQRFRTGGRSAVQEWTIRVGVFEGMLYAVLRSLAKERRSYGSLSIEPMLPGRVNRYWFEDYLRNETGPLDLEVLKKSAREVKQMKIKLVHKLLQIDTKHSSSLPFTIDRDAAIVVSTFLDANNVTKQAGKPAKERAKSDEMQPSALLKFDDLADSFLQGLAWLQWQNNRLKCVGLEHEKRPVQAFWDWINDVKG